MTMYKRWSLVVFAVAVACAWWAASSHRAPDEAPGEHQDASEDDPTDQRLAPRARATGAPPGQIPAQLADRGLDPDPNAAPQTEEDPMEGRAPLEPEYRAQLQAAFEQSIDDAVRDVPSGFPATPAGRRLTYYAMVSQNHGPWAMTFYRKALGGIFEDRDASVSLLLDALEHVPERRSTDRFVMLYALKELAGESAVSALSDIASRAIDPNLPHEHHGGPRTDAEIERAAAVDALVETARRGSTHAAEALLEVAASPPARAVGEAAILGYLSLGERSNQEQALRRIIADDMLYALGLEEIGAEREPPSSFAQK
jgi:hypothetical protein